ncbi:monovalent cation/proton antiporter, MnhG/PhaG subunit [Desulfonatronospira thiodismutans ASO3-1]|uniref:Monovalent cation/proton antiporter, MnhG/PhaG subunit n=1 Tax=Desulfonatronospira thiodismutans ASO3-1 TaxID=555779 RepID=D6SQJ4_9BACT|nr:monovalent cation/H(+) antiporter subunit G [Desulfonatronospira thiodismutans]EFI35020.1 monovalent cation/proton antiporter, MnhG/PhaG subunit [Desulfonatronospira thiodismutans ASO3-1]
MVVIIDALAIIFMLAGAVFMLAGSIGILRFPDVYCRAHAATKVDTLGIMLFILGLALFEGFNLVSVKMLLVAAFVALTSPVAAHALSRRAMLHGVKPWTRKQKKEG